MPKEIRTKSSNEPVKPDVKTQAAGKFRYDSFANDKVERLPGLKDVVFPLDKTPMENWISYNNKASGNDPKPITPAEQKVSDAVERSNKLSDTRTADASAFYNPKKMSATRSWQIIKQSMSKDELEEHYRDHPKDRPVKLTPVKLDQGLTDMLGDDWEL